MRRYLATFVAMVLLLAACGDGDRGGGGGGGATQEAASPGITDTEIKIGTSTPFSGPASAFGTVTRAEEAYFKYVNEERGGVRSADGKTRKVNFIALDDAYTPARTVENTRRLIEQDQVFGLFGIVGAPTNDAIWDYVNQQQVPHLWVAAGVDKYGADVKGHPWSTGFNPSYSAEVGLYVEFLKRDKPTAKVAVLYQNDDLGKSYLERLERFTRGTQITLHARQSYEVTDPTVDSQVVNLAGSGADTFFFAGTPRPAAQAIKKVAEVGWKPLFIVGFPAASPDAVFRPAGLQNARGIYSLQFHKDPTDPQWANDADVKAYRERVAKYCANCKAEDPSNVFGFLAGQLMVKTIEGMNAPTRKALMDSARNIDTELDLLLPGIKAKTGPEDGFPFETLQVSQFDGQNYKPVGGVVDVSGRAG